MTTFCRHYSCGMRLLLRNGVIYANGPQPLTSMLVVDDRIAWVGRDHSGHPADRTIDLDGRILTPAFVDAHLHATATGLETVDCAVSDPVSLLQRFTPSDDVVIGHGWDDTSWPSHWFSLGELDRRVGETLVYASRVDVHSALVSSALLARIPSELDGWSPSGIVSRAAHGVARDLAFARLSDAQRRNAQQRTLSLAAARGVACIQEMAGPHVSSVQDAALLMEQRSAHQPDIALWWGELNGFDTAHGLGAHGIGGDLVIDGSVGSRTAAFRSEYDDAPTCGVLYRTNDELVTHIAEAVRRGLPTAFHAIGDAAIRQVLDAYSEVVRVVGSERLRAGRHRIEHCELLDGNDLRRMAEFGIIASVQPHFDAAWGGSGGMYAQRLGPVRAAGMNRFATMVREGVQLAFGSDAPVTALDPWGTVHAAMEHRTDSERLTQRAAIAAHTRGGWRSIGIDDAGMLTEGWKATFAVWEHDAPVEVQVDERLAGWSTDPRAGVPQLPDMRQARCVLTVREGEWLFDALS